MARLVLVIFTTSVARCFGQDLFLASKLVDILIPSRLRAAGSVLWNAKSNTSFESCDCDCSWASLESCLQFGSSHCSACCCNGLFGSSHGKLRAASSSNEVGIFYESANQWKCLDLPGGDTKNGNRLQLWDCNGLKNQKWVFAPSSWKIVYAGDPSKCIDVAGDWSNGNSLQLWDCNGQKQQVWGYDANMHTIFLAQSASDASKCMDLRGGDASNGNTIDIWDCLGNNNQKWNFHGPSPGPSPPGPSPPGPSPPGPSPSPGPQGSASTTRYWDCSRPTCSWCGKCAGSGKGSSYAADWNQLFKSGNEIFGTVASSGSFGQDDKGDGCNRCYKLGIKDGPARGKAITVMATNFCPDQPTCPKTSGATNQYGEHYHFDLAIPGGGVGGANKCNQEYPGVDFKVKNRNDCNKLPSNLRSGCYIWFDDLNGMDNPKVNWWQVECPSVLTSKCR